MSDERFEVVIVGAGPAGAAAALVLAREGVEVLILERGDFPGAKNLFGGILYTSVVNELIPEFWENAPIERHIVNRRWMVLDEDTQIGLDLKSAKFDVPPFNNTFTALRSKWDRWFAEQAEDAGAMLICETNVEELIIEQGKVKGVRTGRDDGDVEADVVILAEGANALIAERAGFRPQMSPRNRVSAVKEVIALPAEIIEDRFHLEGRQGMALEYFGGAVKGTVGSAFIYTNHDSLSVGVGCMIEEFLRLKIAPYDMLDDFKSHPMIAPLLRGGETVEYATKMIPEDSYDSLSDLFEDGLLLIGDCAGLVNPSIHHEGTNLAMASGVAAAQAVLSARKANDFSKARLAEYRERLEDSWVMKDLRRYRDTVHFLLENRELVNEYPDLAIRLVRRYFTLDDTPKDDVLKELWKTIRSEVDFFKAARQMWRARKNML